MPNFFLFTQQLKGENAHFVYFGTSLFTQRKKEK
uniref:Uncharacterized protein n=1 Tax=Anguilla anguilla TaxID=7936 RepID=A0A0E9UNZ1_ANGAN